MNEESNLNRILRGAFWHRPFRFDPPLFSQFQFWGEPNRKMSRDLTISGTTGVRSTGPGLVISGRSPRETSLVASIEIVGRLSFDSRCFSQISIRFCSLVHIQRCHSRWIPSLFRKQKYRKKKDVRRIYEWKQYS